MTHAAPNIFFRMRSFAGLLLGAFLVFPPMLVGPQSTAPSPPSGPAPATPRATGMATAGA